MRYGEDGAVLHQVRQGVLHEAFGHGVEGARRLVEDKYRRVAENGSRDRDALPFAAGEHKSLFAHDAAVAFRLGHYEVVRVRHLGGGDNLVVRGVGGSVPDVLLDRVVEEQGLLHDGAHEAAEVGDLHVAQIDAVDCHSALLRVVEAGEEPAQCRFAAAGAAHDGHHLAARDGERCVRHGWMFGRVVLECDVAE